MTCVNIRWYFIGANMFIVYSVFGCININYVKRLQKSLYNKIKKIYFCVLNEAIKFTRKYFLPASFPRRRRKKHLIVLN